MKYFFLIISLGIVISFFGSCEKDSNETVPAFNYEQAAGIWVPYELTVHGATISPHHGRFTGHYLFGTSAESVELHSDKSFIPVQWTNKDTFHLITDENGTFEYFSDNKLKFKNWIGLDRSKFDREWDLIKFEGNDLWLKIDLQKFYVGPGTSEYVYKFKRQR